MTEDSFSAYMSDLFGEEDPFLREMRQEATKLGLPSIQVPVEVGRLLQVLVAQLDARRILEIGTLFGYSTVLLARAMDRTGSLVSLEVNPIHASLARDNLERAGLAGQVEVRVGSANDSLAELMGQTFDLIFIDADKESYVEYLHQALTLAHRGTVIVADNLWRNGSVVSPDPADDSARAIREFNHQLVHSRDLVTTFLPTRAGADAVSLSVVIHHSPD